MEEIDMQSVAEEFRRSFKKEIGYIDYKYSWLGNELSFAFCSPTFSSEDLRQIELIAEELNLRLKGFYWRTDTDVVYCFLEVVR
jgi:hypothetical protein